MRTGNRSQPASKSQFLLESALEREIFRLFSEKLNENGASLEIFSIHRYASRRRSIIHRRDTFRADAAGTYTIHAKNNGVDATVTITVKAPTPPPTTNPDTGASSGSDSGASSGSETTDPGSSSADGQ